MGLGFRVLGFWVLGFGCKAKQTTHVLMVLPSAALHVYPVFGPEADTLKEFPQPIIEDLGFRAWGSSLHHLFSSCSCPHLLPSWFKFSSNCLSSFQSLQDLRVSNAEGLFGEDPFANLRSLRSASPRKHSSKSGACSPDASFARQAK